jgi:septum formation topological specificity factor MinE
MYFLPQGVHSVTLTLGIQCKLPVSPSMAATSISKQIYSLTTLRCFGAASAKERLDIVIRDAINAGDIPGPRYLANGKEMARRDGDLVAGITAYADGPDEMREVIRQHVKLGVDQIKLSMSGEEARNYVPVLTYQLLTVQ